MGPRPQQGGRERGGRQIRKGSSGRTAPCNDADIPNGFLNDASLSYMTTTATEARSQARQSGSPAASVPAGRGPPGKRPTPPAPTQRQKGVGRTVLPVPVRPRSDRIVSSREDSRDRFRQVLVVQYRRALVHVPHRRQVPHVGGLGTGHVEEDSQDMRVESATSSGCAADVR